MSAPARGARLGPGLCAALIALSSSTARAQALGANATLSEALFQDGKRLMVEGRFTEACPKLAESLRLDPGDGTRVILGQCYERVGKTASAWLLYGEVVGRPDADATQLGRAARQLRDKLEPRLTRLALRVAPEVVATPGLEVRVDGDAIQRAAYGVPFPVDPGDHRVAATAPGRREWSRAVDAQGAGLTEVDVPALEVEPAAPAPAAPPPVIAPPPPAPAPRPAPGPSADPGAGRRTAGFVVGAAGLVAIGVGSYFGVRAITKKGDADALCPGVACANDEALAASHDSIVAGNVATALVGAGALALGAGAVLVLTAPRARTSPAGARGATVALSTMGPLGVALRGTLP